MISHLDLEGVFSSEILEARPIWSLTLRSTKRRKIALSLATLASNP